MICNAKAKLTSGKYFFQLFQKKSILFLFLRNLYKNLCRRRTSMPNDGATIKMKLLLNVPSDGPALLLSCRYYYYYL